jgi:hypothetical protein
MQKNALALALASASTALSLTGVASADDEKSASAIMPGCRLESLQNKNILDGWLAGLCNGMVYALSIAVQTEPQGTRAFCIPPDVTTAQAVRVVASYIDAHPERMREDFALLAFKALVVTWPCKR